MYKSGDVKQPKTYEYLQRRERIAQEMSKLRDKGRTMYNRAQQVILMRLVSTEVGGGWGAQLPVSRS